MKIIGIDPGLQGCVAYLDDAELLLTDMPVLSIERNGKARNRIDTRRLYDVISGLKADHAYIELVNALPGCGTAHSFSFGFGCGIIEGVVVACGLPFTMVSSMKWKKAMGCPKDKDGARQRASQLLPAYAHNWDLKKHDGRAESALLAMYGRGIQPTT